jgi:hypothetical protein
VQYKPGKQYGVEIQMVELRIQGDAFMKTSINFIFTGQPVIFFTISFSRKTKFHGTA